MATTTTAAEVAGCTKEETGPFRIVLVNDDGVINPAIDVLIDRLAQIEDVEVDVTVVAPAEERSGTSDTSTPGGNAAYSVDGYPADAVNVALDSLALEPHLVVSGINPIADNCEALIAGEFQTDTLASTNIPACAPELMGELQEVPRALEIPEVPEGDSIFASLCDLADPAPADEIAAVRSGYPSLTQVEAEL